MAESRGEGSPAPGPRQAVASAIQDLVAVRLGRGFAPLALLLLAGLLELGIGGLADRGGLLLSAGSLVAGGTMLAHGLGVVQEAFGRRRRPWMVAAKWGSFVPLLFGLYVLGWRGLRQLAALEGLASAGLGILFAVIGTWLLRSWTRVVEVERLARFMLVGLDERGDET